MIPEIFYDSAISFTQPVGRLADCTRCIVTEERNGIYELEFDYPVGGAYFGMLNVGTIICAIPFKGGAKQPFEIYQRTATIDGMATFYAHHISYRLSYLINGGMTANTAANALNNLFLVRLFPTQEYADRYPFTAGTDLVKSGTFHNPYVQSVKSLLWGQRGSIVDVYGGEFEFNVWNVFLHESRGSDNGVTIRYGKNLVDLEDTFDGDYLYNAVIPFWYDEENDTCIVGSLVTSADSTILWNPDSLYGPNIYITDENERYITFQDGLGRAVPLDLSDEYENQPTAAQLEAKAATYLSSNQPWLPKRKIEVDFVDLSQTKEYEGLEMLESVNLCDTVHIIYEQLGIVAHSKVIKTEWNVLLDRYDKITVGDPIDEYGKYTGKVTIGTKTFKIVNGLITNVK